MKLLLQYRGQMVARQKAAMLSTAYTIQEKVALGETVVHSGLTHLAACFSCYFPCQIPATHRFCVSLSIHADRNLPPQIPAQCKCHSAEVQVWVLQEETLVVPTATLKTQKRHSWCVTQDSSTQLHWSVTCPCNLPCQSEGCFHLSAILEILQYQIGPSTCRLTEYLN